MQLKRIVNRLQAAWPVRDLSMLHSDIASPNATTLESQTRTIIVLFSTDREMCLCLKESLSRYESRLWPRKGQLMRQFC